MSWTVVVDFSTKHAKLYGIPVCERYVVGKVRVTIAHAYFLKNNHAKFHLQFAFQNLVPMYFLSEGLVLLDPEHCISV